MEELGRALAYQAKLKSAQVILGPTINIHRDPRGGRNFECFSEDPLLSGQLAAGVVRGIQSQGVAACPKHFACNESEFKRREYNVAQSHNSRAVREIYLAAFQEMLRRSEPHGLMVRYVSRPSSSVFILLLHVFDVYWMIFLMPAIATIN